MPIYEYDCQKCGTFETTQKITEKPLAKCPTCKGKVKKLISNTSFQLKGTGWYVTDYARKGIMNGEGNGAKSSARSQKANQRAIRRVNGSPSKSEKSSSSSSSSTSSLSTITHPAQRAFSSLYSHEIDGGLIGRFLCSTHPLRSPLLLNRGGFEIHFSL